MGWRDMTEHEVATLPEARLGGALLWMVVAALFPCIVGIAGAVFAFDQLCAIGGRYAIAVGFVVVWSLAFVVMTVLRVRATPVLASAGFLAWIVYRFAVAMLAHAGWPLAIDVLGELVFCYVCR